MDGRRGKNVSDWKERAGGNCNLIDIEWKRKREKEGRRVRENKCMYIK